MDTSVSEIAKLVGGTVIGDPEVRIRGVNGIEEAGTGDLTFVRDARYYPLLATTGASAALVPSDAAQADMTLIRVSNPDVAFGLVLRVFWEEQVQRPKGIHPTAVVGKGVALGRDVALDAHVVLDEGCRVGDRAVLYAGAYVGRDACIGPDTVVYPNVTILDRVSVGARCILHSGVVLGADGFGFVPVRGTWQKIPQVGTVVLGDDVEVGANTTIDRATFGQTSVGTGTKIDNLVQIGHNVRIGEHCVVAGTAGFAGSAVVGNHVMVGARAGIGGHLVVGDGVQVGALSGVTKSIEPGQVVSGYPAIDHNRDKRIQASQRQLPEALRRIRLLEQRLLELEEHVHGKSADHS